MEERVRAEIAAILGTAPDARIVDRLYAVVAQEVASIRAAYDSFIADQYEVEAL